MSNQQTKLFLPYDRFEFTATTKLICKSQNVTPYNAKPQKRYGHLSFIYKSKLYLIGGSLIDNKNQPITNPDLKTIIYSYNLQKQRILPIDDKIIKKVPDNSDVKWQVNHAKISPQAEPEFSTLSHAAYCIFPHKKRLYIFGGSSPEGKPSGNLFRLDLDSLQWSKPQQKGTAPKAREDASLSLYTKNDKNYLVLYGGANYETYELFGDINIYQIETKYWFHCHNLSQNFIQPRISPGICFNDNKIYLFGGYYLDTQYNKGYLNDLYEIQFSITLEKGRSYGRSFVKRLDEIFKSEEKNPLVKPQKRCSSSLIFYKTDFTISNQLRKQYKLLPHWLLLIGGQKACDEKKKQVSTSNDLWIFSLSDFRWINVNLMGQLKPRCYFSATFDKQSGKVFIFGGLSSSDMILNDFLSLKINSKCKEVEQDELKISKDLLEDEKLKMTGQKIQDYFIEQICNSITFPFSAISMIIDNFVHFQSAFCDITYHISKSKNLSHNYIKFESNANFMMSNETIVSHFTCLKGGIRTYVQGTDKKIKSEMNKENFLKEIGTNFVIGGLRLGNQLIFLNLNKQTFEIQIIVVLKCNLGRGSESKQQKQKNDDSFRLFDFLILREQILSDDALGQQKNNQEAKKRKQFFEKICPQQSRDRIRTLIVQGINSIKKGQVKNVFYISKLFTIERQQCTVTTNENELQLYPDMFINDLIFGDRQTIREIQCNTQIPIYQCMDVSLRTYISYLYTQNYQIEITLTIQGLDRKPIILLESLLRIDYLLDNKFIVEVSKSFDIESCKIIELYTFAQSQLEQPKPLLKNGSSKIRNQLIAKFFAHGALYYHKARLIKRQPIPLGNFLLEYRLAKIRYSQQDQKPSILGKSCYYSASEIFGHIELPQAVPVNLTKTDFVFPVMLEKFDQKLKLMEDKVIKEKKNKKIKQKNEKDENQVNDIKQ